MIDELKPGEMREIPEFDNSEHPKVKTEPKLEFSENLIVAYSAFRDQVYSPKSVLYPSSGFDASASRVFPNITFVDLEQGNEGCIETLRKHGLNALKSDIRLYKPKELHDLLILLNPAIYGDGTLWATQHITPGGYIISNNYHGNASWMNRNSDKFSLAGTIDVKFDWNKEQRVQANTHAVISRDLDGLFTPVKNLEEFRRLRPRDYQVTMQMIKSFESTGILQAGKPIEEQWIAYMESMGEKGMPAKRVADHYIFRKVGGKK